MTTDVRSPRVSLHEAVEQIIFLIAHRGDLTRSEALEKVDGSRSTIDNALHQLLAEGRIHREGNGGDSRYVPGPSPARPLAEPEATRPVAPVRQRSCCCERPKRYVDDDGHVRCLGCGHATQHPMSTTMTADRA